MTSEAQRTAIAEACGWKEGTTGLWKDPDRSGYYVLPNYLHDLNDMHEAEKVLTTDSQKDNYHDAICDVLIGNSSFRWTDTFSVITATAAQRAEAFLRTLDLWKE